MTARTCAGHGHFRAVKADSQVDGDCGDSDRAFNLKHTVKCGLEIASAEFSNAQILDFQIGVDAVLAPFAAET